MLDIGWTELVVIAIVLIVVVGPKDLPPMLRAFGRTTTKMRGMAADFRRQFDEALREADLDDVRKTISDAQSLNPATTLRDAMNPLRQLGDEIKSDLQKAAAPVKPEQPIVPEPVSEMASVPAAPAEPASPGAAIAAPAAGPASREAESPARAAARTVEAKPKRVVKPKVDSASPTAPASAKPAANGAAGAAASKKSTAKKAAAGQVQAEAKSGKTRATSRRKGDA